MDQKYEVLRDHLNELGYLFPLSEDSVPLVDKLLSDLIQTTNSLKYFKEIAQKVIEEKDAFLFDVEPYKCDNAKLVAECNSLHLQLLHCKEHADQSQREFKRQIKKLEAKNSELRSKNCQLECDLTKRADRTYKKSSSDAKIYDSTSSQGLNCRAKATGEMCTCNKKLKRAEQQVTNLSREVNNLKDDTLLQLELIESYKNQLNSREKEIERISHMLKGGRTAQVLAQDCCYKDVDGRMSQLTKEVTELKRTKNQLEIHLTDAVLKQHEAMKHAVNLADRNKQLEKELRDIDHMALAVEADCNSTVKQNSDKVYAVQKKLNDAVTKIFDLERKLLEINPVLEEKDNIQKVLDSVLEEKKSMTDRINQYTIIEHDLNLEIDRLSTALSLQKRRIAELEAQVIDHQDSNKVSFIKNRPSNGRNVKKDSQGKSSVSGKRTVKTKNEKGFGENNNLTKEKSQFENELKTVNRQTEHCTKYHGAAATVGRETVSNCLATLDRLQAERDYFCREYQRLRDLMENYPEQPQSIIELKRQLNEKENALVTLQQELRDITRQKHDALAQVTDMQEKDRWEGQRPTSAENASPRSTVRKLELERDLAKSDITRLEEERDSLRMRLKMATEMQKSECKRYENLAMENEQRIRKLEAERHDILMDQSSRRAALGNLEEQCSAYKDQIKAAHAEICHFRALYGQLKTLHEQTDRALGDSQCEQSRIEKDLQISKDRIRDLERENCCTNKDLSNCKNDLVVLRTKLSQIDQEKDDLVICLDEKTEQLQLLKDDLQLKENRILALEMNAAEISKKMSITIDEMNSRQATARCMQSECAVLRREIDSLRNSKDNAITENMRIQNELASLTTDYQITCENLEAARREVETLKTQLQGYVTEVSRIEEILTNKESERNEMLDHFRELSQEATVLENNNHSLESETAQVKKELAHAREKISDLNREMQNQESIAHSYECQISDLTAEVARFEMQLQQCTDKQQRTEAELATTRELCMKLDNQKEIMMRETSDKDAFRLQLERDLERLREDNETLQSELAQKSAQLETLEDMLATSRQETIEQKLDKQDLEMKLAKCKCQIEELKNKLAEFRDDST